MKYCYDILINQDIVRVYLEPCQIYKIINVQKAVNYFCKRSILDVWQSSEYA